MIRGKPIRTTVSDKAAPCPLDKVNRQFHAPAPNRLWVSDFDRCESVPIWLQGKSTVNPTNPESEFAMQ